MFQNGDCVHLAMDVMKPYPKCIQSNIRKTLSAPVLRFCTAETKHKETSNNLSISLDSGLSHLLLKWQELNKLN